MKKILLGILFPVSVFSQWTNNSALNTAVCTASADQTAQRIISDGAGGAIIVWTDFRPTGNTDIYAQRIDSTGTPEWTADGVLICADTFDQTVPVIAQDGNGGAIIVWKDQRNGNSDIYAQHINNSGTIQWGAGGIAVDTKTGEQIDPKIITNDSGETIIIWQDSVSGNWDIYAQKLNFSGAKIWSGGGVAVCVAADGQKNPNVEFDGAGGAIIVWQDRRNGNDYDIYAQRLNSLGVPQWTPNGVAVCLLGETQNNPRIKSDGSGGAIIVWIDKRDGGNYDIYAQRLNSSGAPQWAANGKMICAEADNQSAIDISTKNIPGAIITWKDYRNNIYADIYAQYINLNGDAQWTINGIAVSTKILDQLNPNIITDSAGAIIVWQDSSSGQWDIYGQKILLDKTLVWGTNGKIIANASANQLSPKHISDGKGGAIAVFEDNRNGKYDIYAQNINSDGSLGTIVGIENGRKKSEDSGWKIYPNPNDGRFEVQITNQNEFANYEFVIYNLFGEKTYSCKIPNPESQTLNLDFPSGIYFYKISSENNFVQTGKIMVK